MVWLKLEGSIFNKILNNGTFVFTRTFKINYLRQLINMTLIVKIANKTLSSSLVISLYALKWNLSYLTFLMWDTISLLVFLFITLKLKLKSDRKVWNKHFLLEECEVLRRWMATLSWELCLKHGVTNWYILQECGTKHFFSFFRWRKVRLITGAKLFVLTSTARDT